VQNPTAGLTPANELTVPVAPDGKVRFYNNNGSVDLIADLAGLPQRVGGVRNLVAPVRGHGQLRRYIDRTRAAGLNFGASLPIDPEEGNPGRGRACRRRPTVSRRRLEGSS
jgi:hypothetical protein